MKSVLRRAGVGSLILHMETSEDLSDKKPEGGKRTTMVYIWGKKDP